MGWRRAIATGWGRWIGQRAVVVAAVLMMLTTGTLHADGKWLDIPTPQWNNPGGWPTAAPPGANLDRCGQQERQPAFDEESQVAAANWRLATYWPMQTNGKVSVVMATASYDGMCRPWLFNAFVFYDHRYAGTLSPMPMNSREDGVLNTAPVVLPDGRITAQFTRYAATDPLCCPSRGASAVTYRISGDPALPFVVVEGVAPPATPSTPTQLPSTGDQDAPAVAGWGVLAGIAVLAAAGALRSRLRRQA